MALERKDGRFKMDPDAYLALTAIAESHGMEFGEFVEAEMLKIVRQQVHTAMVLTAKTAGLDIPGIFRESQAKPPAGGK